MRRSTVVCSLSVTSLSAKRKIAKWPVRCVRVHDITIKWHPSLYSLLPLPNTSITIHSEDHLQGLESNLSPESDTRPSYVAFEKPRL